MLHVIYPVLRIILEDGVHADLDTSVLPYAYQHIYLLIHAHGRVLPVIAHGPLTVVMSRLLCKLHSGSGFTADNKTAEHALTGTVDYFSKQEYDPAPDAIESTLSGLGLIWELNSVQYEDETELIHHEWTWSMR